MHKKPTQEFGYVAFYKDGRKASRTFKLAEEKELQEKGALELFIDKFNISFPNRQIKEFVQLQENDQDFLIKTSKIEIEIQLTELTDRSFLTLLSSSDYNNGDWNVSILKSPNEHYKVNTQKLDNTLVELIRKKINKNYSKNEKIPLWLVIFTTSFYLTEYWQYGKLHKTNGLLNAQEYLNSLQSVIFDEIWFTDLKTMPVKIWP